MLIKKVELPTFIITLGDLINYSTTKCINRMYIFSSIISSVIYVENKKVNITIR